MASGRVKLLPAEAKKLGSDSNSGQFTLRRTVVSHRNWTLTLIFVWVIVFHYFIEERIYDSYFSRGCKR
jgi:hypothetical protein